MRTRQAVLVKPGKFVLKTVDVKPGPTDVLVKMEGCGLCTWELNHWHGRLGKCPQPLGHEGWGTVVKAGAKCTRVKVGDRVTGLSGKNFADYFIFPEVHTMVIKSNQRNVPGEPLYCVQNVVRAAHPQVSDCLAIVGCGPMGLWSLQALVSPQLMAAIAIDVDEDKLDLARLYGATHTINPKKEDPAKAIEKITGSRLADVAVECTGAPVGMKTAIEILRGRRPKLVVCSSFKGPFEVDVPALLAKAIEVHHAHPGISLDVTDGVRRTEVLINNGTFKTDRLISHQFKLADINKAFAAMEDRGAGYLKGCIVP
jgi:threonine dehydrogenase-like Zn-dependent dehydrogenase